MEGKRRREERREEREKEGSEWEGYRPIAFPHLSHHTFTVYNQI